MRLLALLSWFFDGLLGGGRARSNAGASMRDGRTATGIRRRPVGSPLDARPDGLLMAAPDDARP